MPKKILLTLATSAILFSNSGHSQPPVNCDCLWQGPFSQIIDNADLIVSGEVIGRKGNSADFNISQTYFDRAVNFKEFQPTIRLWGDDGKQCRPAIDQFPKGTQWLLALNKITETVAGGFDPNTPNVSYGRINDYYLSQCGVYWLPINEGMVSGPLAKSERWQWQQPATNPVLLELVAAYIEGVIPEQALIEASKPLNATKKLMEETKHFIQQQ